MDKTRCLAFLLFLTLSLASFSESDSPLGNLDQYIEQAIDDWEIPGVAIAIVKNNEILYAKGFGVRELGDPSPVDRNTLFQVGSITKSVTGAAFAILVDEGRVRWDDKVVDYLPWFRLHDPWLTEHITVRDLLAHKTGLRDAWYFYYTPMDAEETIRRMRHIDNFAAFRQDAEYSNLMYAVAGEVLAKVAGMPWKQFVQTRVLDALGMRHTGTSAFDFWDRKYVTTVFLGDAPAGNVTAQDANVDNIAMPHHRWGEQEIKSVPWQYYDNADAAGTIVSNVMDLATWMRFHLGDGELEGDRLISESNFAELHTPQMLLPLTWSFPTTDGMPPEPGSLSYTFGWIRTEYRGSTLLAHGGGIIGFPAHIAILPEHGLGIVVLANGTNSQYPMHRQISFHVFDKLLNLPEHDWRKTFMEKANQGDAYTAERESELGAARLRDTRPSLALKDYTGVYEDELVGNIEVGIDNGALRLFVPGEGLFSGTMQHWHNDTFRLHWQGVFSGFTSFVNFEVDPSGEILELQAEYVGDFSPTPTIVAE